MTIYPVARNPITRQAVPFLLNAGGVPISGGVQGDLSLPWNSRIVAVRLQGRGPEVEDVPLAGSISIDLWANSGDSYPPTVADSIIGEGTKPALVDANYAVLDDLSDWTTVDFADETNLTVVVDDAETLVLVTMTLIVERL